MEHVWDPLTTARGAFELLKPGGAFLIVVHNRAALSAKVLGLKSPIFDIEHLQLFSRHSVRQLFERAGFSGSALIRSGTAIPFHYWMKLFPMPGPFKPRVLAMLKKSPVGKMAVSVPAGNLVAIGFREG